MIASVDLTSWLLWAVLWAVLFAAVIFLIYKVLPVRSARGGSDAVEEGMQPPPSGDGHAASIRHRGSWWRKEDGDVYLWLDEKRGRWLRYRRASACPYCGAAMPVHERRCGECRLESNPLEQPDPISDFPEEVEVVEG
jgi:hypothetical protein